MRYFFLGENIVQNEGRFFRCFLTKTEEPTGTEDENIKKKNHGNGELSVFEKPRSTQLSSSFTFTKTFIYSLHSSSELQCLFRISVYKKLNETKTKDQHYHVGVHGIKIN